MVAAAAGIGAVGIGLGFRQKRIRDRSARRRRRRQLALLARQTQRALTREAISQQQLISGQTAAFGAAGVEAGIGVASDVRDQTTFESNLRRREMLAGVGERADLIRQRARQELQASRERFISQVSGIVLGGVAGGVQGGAPGGIGTGRGALVGTLRAI